MSQAPSGALPPITSTQQAMRQHPGRYGMEAPAPKPKPKPVTEAKRSSGTRRMTLGALADMVTEDEAPPRQNLLVEASLQSDPLAGVRLAARGLAGLGGGRK